jgi:L-fucose mutarotase/ribose pyranase (RbsD/FucU family)
MPAAFKRDAERRETAFGVAERFASYDRVREVFAVLTTGKQRVYVVTAQLVQA